MSRCTSPYGQFVANLFASMTEADLDRLTDLFTPPEQSDDEGLLHDDDHGA